jgi:hypothetical protein
MAEGRTLEAEEDPLLPASAWVPERLTPRPPNGVPSLDPPPTANADVLARYRPFGAVPIEYRPGGALAVPHKPQVGVVVWAAGVEVKARDILRYQPTLSATVALQGAAKLLCLHETFHSYVDQARQHFKALTGHNDEVDVVDLEEALANAFAARNVSEPLADAQVAIAEAGDLVGYAELSSYLKEVEFHDGLLELGRAYFGDQYAHLILDVVEHNDASDTEISLGLPDNERLSAYRAGAWRIHGGDYRYVIDEVPF